jgi:hypothetical protein
MSLLVDYMFRSILVNSSNHQHNGMEGTKKIILLHLLKEFATF